MPRMLKKFISFSTLIICDLVSLFICFSLAFTLRSYILPLIFNTYIPTPVWPIENFRTHYYMAFLWVFIFAYENLYTKRFPRWEETFILIKGTTISFALVMILIFITKKELQFSRAVIVLAWGLSLFIFPLSRYLTKLILIKLKLWKKKLLIIGANPLGFNVVKSIRQNKSMGYEIIGFLDDDPQAIGKTYDGIQVIAPISRLEEVSLERNSKDIFIALPHLSKDDLSGLLQKCEKTGESMRIVPRIGDLITTGVEAESLGQVLTLNVKNNLAKPWNILIKNLYDLASTFVLTTLLLPLFAVISIAIKLDSKGPVFFVQKRTGKNKKVFRIIKFRSMYVNSDAELNDFLNHNSHVQQEWAKYRKIKGHDPRVTRVGKVIRKFSLDELPQVFNVLRGEMSLVGPRPYLPEELEEKEHFGEMVARVKPGLTGLWQISGRNALPFSERMTMDEYYIRNWSLWLDMVIFLKTIRVFFSGKGAF